MISEVCAVEFELNSDSLPPLALRIDASLCLTVRICGVDSLNDEAQFVADHTEKENNALFIYWCVPKTAKVDWWPKLWTLAFVPDHLSRERRFAVILAEQATHVSISTVSYSASGSLVHFAQATLDIA